MYLKYKTTFKYDVHIYFLNHQLCGHICPLKSFYFTAWLFFSSVLKHVAVLQQKLRVLLKGKPTYLPIFVFKHNWVTTIKKFN